MVHLLPQTRKHHLLTEIQGFSFHFCFYLNKRMEMEGTRDATLHLRRKDTTGAPLKLHISPLNIMPQSALGSNITSFHICSLTTVAARDDARRLSAPQPNQFLSPLVAFSARRYSNANAIIKRLVSAFSISPRNRCVVLVACL